MSFGVNPIWLVLLLPLLPLLAWSLFSARRRAALKFCVPPLHALDRSWRQRSRWLPPALWLAAFLLLAFSLLRPQQGLTQRTTDVDGIAIELVLDCSGSMEQEDFVRGDQAVTRLAAAKEVARDFVAGNGRLPGRPSDSIGLTTFARFAERACPSTIDHRFLLARLDQTEIVNNFRHDGTAIGEALGLAVAKLHELDSRGSSANRIPGKVVILLTDGENNAGQLHPLRAAELAAVMGVRVYAIAVGPAETSGAGHAEPEAKPRLASAIEDRASLQQIAEITGARAYAASDSATLEAIYAEIDRLERSPLEQHRYTDYRQLAIEPFALGVFHFPPLALAALVLLSLEAILAQTVFRTIP